MMRRKWGSLLTFAVAGLVPATAAANGRFPAANQIVVDPTDSNHLVVRTTYGILVSSDGGKAWDWVCEQAVEWTGQYDPPVTLTKDGTLIAGVYDHLGVGTQGGCAWDRPAPLEQKNVIDVSTQKNDTQVAVALTSNAMAGGMFVTQVWRSSDNGAAWAKVGIDLPTDFVGTTLDVAPSDPKFIIASGQIGKGGPGVLQVSNDDGMTWVKHDIPGTDIDHVPYIAAIDPNDPLKIYVRLTGPQGVLLATADGGGSWTTVFTGQGILKGFALAPDGSSILAGGETDGIHQISTADFSETQISTVHAQCLVWTESAIFACGPEAKDGYTVGKSVDGGKTFTPLIWLAWVGGPRQGVGTTDVGMAGPAVWPATAELIDTASCAMGTGGAGGAGGAGVGGSGGSGESSSSSSSGASTSGAGGGPGNTDGTGCGTCGVGSTSGKPLGGIVLAVAGAASLLRARRRFSKTNDQRRIGNQR